LLDASQRRDRHDDPCGAEVQESLTKTTRLSSELIGMLSSSSTELEAAAQSMTGVANQSKQQVAVPRCRRRQAPGMQTVASASEELAASIGEIGRQVTQSSRITAKAVDDAKHTDSIVHALAEGAEKIVLW
jgi:methyl-accepting chemotaxis protein